MSPGSDVVVVGGGVVGAACAYALAGAGARVRLCERSFVASGSSGACEGNVLAWDKALERELPLALRSAELWQQLAHELPDGFEYDRKGEALDADALRAEEPHVAHDLPGGVLYPGDAQLEPRLATAALVRAAVNRGAVLSTDEPVEAIVRGADGRARAVKTARGEIPFDAVV